MTDTPLEQPAPVAEPPAVDDALAEAEKRIRRLRAWVISLSVVLALAVGLVGCAVVGVLVPIMSFAQMEDGSPEAIEAEVRSVYGDRIESLSVEKVTSEDMEAPFPYSLLEGSGGIVHVEFKVKGIEPVFSAVVWTEDELHMRGLFPLEGTITNRLDERQLKEILALWKEHAPGKSIGGILRYADENMMEPGSLPPTITVTGKDFSTKSLWRVYEGDVVVDGKFDGMGEAWTHVLYEDPDTGKFTYLGRERGMTLF